MPGLNFQKQFAPAVKDGTKAQTIRKRRTPPIAEGQHLTLWTGQRTKSCQPLGDATCQMVRPIKIIPERQEIWLWDDQSETIEDGEIVGNFYLVTDTAAFARLDGFDTPDKFFDFFKQYPSDVLHFELVVIYWQLGWDFKRGLTQPAPDAGESAPLQALSTPEHSATSQNLSTPTQRG